MSTAAERQRRSRAHRNGDHSLCDPQRCDGVTVTSAVTVTRARPTVPARQRSPELGPRGRRLWAELKPDTRTPAEVVLIEEACRLADRLDVLDRLLRGDAGEWATVRLPDDGGPIVLVVDAALSQARMHATTLRGIVTELRQSGAAAGGSGKPTGQGGSVVDQVAAARARRLAGAAGQ